MVADALSRAGEGKPRSDTDGSSWTVCEDWEANTGLINYLFKVDADKNDSDVTDKLLQWFKDEPIFMEVVQALQDLTAHMDKRTAQCAQHWAKQYFIQNGKLWKTKGRPDTQGRVSTDTI